MGARFMRDLPAFLRRPIGREEARAIVRQRQERRDADFLALCRAAIYANAASPYRALLGLAGCAYGDLEALVRREGIEAALATLYRAGVYLTLDELKGRRRVVRGSATLALQPGALRRPGAALHVLAQTGGSRGAPTVVPLDLANLRERAANRRLAIDARGGAGWRHGVWFVPGSSEMSTVLRFSACGLAPVRWFAQVDPGATGLHPRYRRSAWALRLGARLAGVRLPARQIVRLEDPLPIARWMAAVLRGSQVPHLKTYAGPAVLLCRAAQAAGVDLRGTQFSLTGEPLTAARLAVIREAGAVAVPAYGAMECGLIADGCLAPAVADDYHQVHDLQAVIQPGPRAGAGPLPPRALLLSSLRPSAPLVLLNVSLGDSADLAPRACGCPLEQAGYATHLSRVRSFEKLTAGGMTFLDAEVERVLEEELPARFGGGPTDYQLLEEEVSDGRPRLRLLVRPSVGPLDEAAVADALLTALGRGSDAARVMELQWRQADLVQVERREPLASVGGKILHLVRG